MAYNTLQVAHTLCVFMNKNSFFWFSIILKVSSVLIWHLRKCSFLLTHKQSHVFKRGSPLPCRTQRTAGWALHLFSLWPLWWHPCQLKITCSPAWHELRFPPSILTVAWSPQNTSVSCDSNGQGNSCLAIPIFVAVLHNMMELWLGPLDTTVLLLLIRQTTPHCEVGDKAIAN